MFHVKQQAASKVFPQVIPIVEKRTNITAAPSSYFTLYFESAANGAVSARPNLLDKKREPDCSLQSGPCLMTTRNRIKCATSVVPYYLIIRQCCDFVSTFLKKIRIFFKKLIPTKPSISLYYNKIHMTTCFLYRLYPLLHRLRGRCRPNNRVRRL